MAKNLDELRAEIDRIDESLLATLSERQFIARAIGTLKKEHGLPALDEQRFHTLLADRMSEGSAKGLSPDFIEALFTLIHEHSVDTQKSL